MSKAEALSCHHCECTDQSVLEFCDDCEAAFCEDCEVNIAPGEGHCPEDHLFQLPEESS